MEKVAVQSTKAVISLKSGKGGVTIDIKCWKNKRTVKMRFIQKTI